MIGASVLALPYWLERKLVDALKPPPRKNPQRRTVSPTLPPMPRSRAAMEFTIAAAQGRFALQKCDECQSVTYPPRETCPNCLSMELSWQDLNPGGVLLAESTVRTSTNTYFRERTPWRIGTVQLDGGLTVLAHIHDDIKPLGRVRMIARTDKSGQGVLMALPEKETEHMNDEAKLRELTCDPKHRRVLITDGRTQSGRALARAVSDAGASIVFVGMSETWRRDGDDDLNAIKGVEIVPLDLTNTDSVNELAAEIGGKTDILINTAEHVRPGGVITGKGVVTARDEMEIYYFGQLRLAQAFGPIMRGRGSDGVNSAAAWVNILSVYALSNMPSFGSNSASQAAALSLSQCLRAEFSGNGVKVVTLFTGPLEEEWRQPLPPPKVTPEGLAAAMVNALQQGLEEVSVGAIAQDVTKRWGENPRLLEREMMSEANA
ncbi:MAG: SDR family NAD(P)-dependent oxidoreductase [Hyphomicrobiales bacterium]